MSSTASVIDISKSRLHVIHYSSDADLPASVKNSLPDSVAQTLFRIALNAHLSEGRTEMHAYIKAYRALESAGYRRDETTKKWTLEPAVQKDNPGVADVHVDRPLGSDEDDAEEDKAPRFLPPVEVLEAAKRAYASGTNVVSVTYPLSNGEGLPISSITEIAKHFEAYEANEPVLTTDAWGGKLAGKWAQRVLKKIAKDPQWEPHILVDLDGTLAEKQEPYDEANIGKPLEPMCTKVRDALKAGTKVRIFTARVADDPDGKKKEAIEAWSLENLGQKLPVTNAKDPGMTELWDDRSHHPDDVAKSGDGVMIAFMLEQDTAAKLAIPDGEEPDELHLTLLYLGKIDAISLNKLRDVETVLEDFASKYAPVSGEIAGPIRFPATEHSDNMDVCVASFSNDNIQDFRRDLLEAVEGAGVEVKDNFSYTPHITLKYISPDESLPVQRIGPIPVTFSSISLSISGARKVYPLKGVKKVTGSKEGSWITVNGQHILVGADGKPLAGNPKALGRKVSAKVETARKNAVLTGAHEQHIADRAEEKLSKALGIPRTRNNSAFDLRNDSVGIECKALVTGRNDKLTMGKPALARKLAEQRADGLKGYTVAVDMRGRTSGKYYIRQGFGSFRLGSMTPVTLSQIKEMVNQ